MHHNSMLHLHTGTAVLQCTKVVPAYMRKPLEHKVHLSNIKALHNLLASLGASLVAL